jgi:large conductance mechanosensitive channel
MAVWNNPTVQNVGGRAKKTLNDFQKFILRGNVVDLAVGIMIGAAFSSVVNALVGDIITPLIPASNTGLSDLTISLPYTHSLIRIGAFINAAISFLVLALVIYFFVVKPINALMALHKPKEEEPPTTRDCPYCLSTIPLQATRCAYCTSPLPPAGQVPPARAQ